MVVSSKGVTNSLTLMNKRPNKIQNASTSITDIANQYFRELLKKFNYSPDIGLKSKQVHNKPTEDYFFLIKQITKLMKIKRHVRSKFVKSGTNETIGQIK